MIDVTFEENQATLRARYHSLLAENGLDSVALSETKARENFDAMFEAGWFRPAAKEQAWVDWNKSRASSRSLLVGYDTLIAQLSSEVEKALRVRGGLLEKPVYAGPWPIGYTNACAMPDESGNLVLVSAGLMRLIYQVGKVFLYSYDWLKVDSAWTNPSLTLCENLGWESYGWTMERTINALVSMYVAYFRQGDPSSAQRQRVPILDGRAATLSHIVHYAEHFVIAHEYAHVVLGHTGPLVTYATPLGPLRDAYERRRQQEIDADELAVSLQLATADLTGTTECGRLDANMRIAGIVLFFACGLMNDVICEGAPGFAMNSHPYSTHPSANERMKRVFSRVERFDAEFRVLATIVLQWVLPVAIFVAEEFHQRREQSGEVFPYLIGKYEPFQASAT